MFLGDRFHSTVFEHDFGRCTLLTVLSSRSATALERYLHDLENSILPIVAISNDDLGIPPLGQPCFRSKLILQAVGYLLARQKVASTPGGETWYSPGYEVTTSHGPAGGVLWVPCGGDSLPGRLCLQVKLVGLVGWVGCRERGQAPGVSLGPFKGVAKEPGVL